jgi:hypothetical protein
LKDGLRYDGFAIKKSVYTQFRTFPQELNGDGTNWLDQAGIPSIAVSLPEYTVTDWQANLDGLQTILDTYGN